MKKNCRICEKKIINIITFNKVALSGLFLKKKQIRKEVKYPLSLGVCKKCKHIQIQNILNPKKLFKNYDWETGISKSNIKLIGELLVKLKNIFNLSHKSKVFEIASNDGTLLEKVKDQYTKNVLGIDPAQNLKKISKQKKVPTIVGFFSLLSSKKILKKYGKFDFCIARNVIAHTNNPNNIFKGVRNILTNNGVFIVEVPHLYNIYKYNQYDNIFHEHHGFHSLKSIVTLCERNNLKIIDVEIIPSQGGSLRCYITQKESCLKKNNKIKTIINQEIKLGLYKINTWKNFVKKINKHRFNLNIFLKKIKNKKKNISAYGASGKGQALLQFCKINKNLIDFIFDKSKFKQNKYTPGTHIKILDPKFINIKKPDYLLLLSWNLLKEIIKQEKIFLKRNGKLIIPFPNPKIIVK
tara:strand:- start:1375 stop:2604 length:1230 start_codon:yes stop_codon:yes gene_type:complete